MANLNLQDKKFITPENLRLIINYGLGFASKVKNLEDKEIAPFEADKIYIKDSLTIYDGYIYKAKVTNQSSTFDKIYWDLIGDDITELTLDEIKAMIGLTQDQLNTLASIILDNEIRLDKTWSSSKTYSDIQDAIKECKQYCITELAKKSTGSFKKANDTSEVTDGNYLYLIMNNTTNKYDIYALVDGNVELLTSVDIDLSDCYTKNEIDNDFLKKTDATLTYATKTELNEKANDDEVIKKADIKTTLDENSTDTDICSGKAIFNAIKKDCVSYSTDEQLTGGTWIDGKPIYRKGGFVKSIPNGTSPVLDSTLTLSLVNAVIQTGGSVLYSSGGIILPIGGFSGDACRGNVGITNRGLVFLVSADAYENVYWWIEYTKKTDA